MLCPCGSNSLFMACCQPFITKISNKKTPNTPSTPEQLMRSRFSAYAIKDGQYIFDTYAEKQRLEHSVDDIQSWADECLWLALVVHKAVDDIVDFSAYYVLQNTLCELREISTFCLEQDPNTDKKQWRYIGGNITVNDELTHIKRNEICPCNKFPTAWSVQKNKKFKHCCGK